MGGRIATKLKEEAATWGRHRSPGASALEAEVGALVVLRCQLGSVVEEAHHALEEAAGGLRDDGCGLSHGRLPYF